MSESSDPAPQLLLRNLEVEDLSALMPQYEFSALIAEGGMGKVFHAVQKSLDRPVAIKLLKSEFGRNEEFRDGFQREAQSMAKLNHPNLVAVYDFGQIQGILFIVMEFVEGQTLHDACHGHPLVAEEAAEVIAGTCRGLAHAHEAGIIHRDIKPANILVDSDLQPKLVDFGVAEAADTVHSSDTQIFGTPDYAAPEMCESPPRVSEKSDIFAVGVLFYELLTGELPSEPYTPPSRITKTSPKYDAIVAKAMQPDPEQRFANVTEFAEAIEKLLANPNSTYFQTQTLTPNVGPALRALAPGISPGAVGGYRPPRAAPVKSGSGGIIMTMLGIGAIAVAGYLLTRNPAETTPATPTTSASTTPDSTSTSPESPDSSSLPASPPTAPTSPPSETTTAEVSPPSTETKYSITPSETYQEPAPSVNQGNSSDLSLLDLSRITPASELHPWTLSDGQIVQASIKGFEDGKVCLTLKGGEAIERSLSEMNAEDNARYLNWISQQRLLIPDGLQTFTLTNDRVLTILPIGLWRGKLLYLNAAGATKSVTYRRIVDKQPLKDQYIKKLTAP